MPIAHNENQKQKELYNSLNFMRESLIVVVSYIDQGEGLHNPLAWNKLLEVIRIDNSMTTRYMANCWLVYNELRLSCVYTATVVKESRSFMTFSAVFAPVLRRNVHT